MTDAEKNATSQQLIYAIKEYCWRRNINVIKECLQNGADINALNEAGRGALTQAIIYGHTEIVRLLIGYGADLNKKETNGFTPLMLAVRDNHTGMAGLLIDGGADIDAKKEGGETALMFCVRMNATKALCLLIERGADLDIRDDNGATALDIARQARLPQAVQPLEKAHEARLHDTVAKKQQKLNNAVSRPRIVPRHQP